jgi:hypothetical protein
MQQHVFQGLHLNNVQVVQLCSGQGQCEQHQCYVLDRVNVVPMSSWQLVPQDTEQHQCCTKEFWTGPTLYHWILNRLCAVPRVLDRVYVAVHDKCCTTENQTGAKLYTLIYRLLKIHAVTLCAEKVSLAPIRVCSEQGPCLTTRAKSVHVVPLDAEPCLWCTTCAG